MHVFCLFPKTRSPRLLHNPFLQNNWWKSKHQMQSLQQMTSVKVPQGQCELQELRGSSTKCKSFPWQPARTALLLVRTFWCKNQITVTGSWFCLPLLMPDASWSLFSCSKEVRKLLFPAHSPLLFKLYFTDCTVWFHFCFTHNPVMWISVRLMLSFIPRFLNWNCKAPVTEHNSASSHKA